MSVTYISIERVTGNDVFTNNQGDPITMDQANGVAQRFMDSLVSRLEEEYPDAEIEVVSGNGLGGGNRVEADTYQEEEAVSLAHRCIAEALWESSEVWSVAEAAGCDRCGDTAFADDQLIEQPNGQRICGACALTQEQAAR